MQFGTRIKTTLQLAAVLCGICAFATRASATAYAWNNTGSGNWNDNTKWTPNTSYPQLAGDVATIQANIAAAQAVTLNVGATVGTLNIGDSATSFFSYTLSGANTLTFDNSGSGAILTKFTTSSSTAKADDLINVPIFLNDNLKITNGNTASSGGVLSLNGIISGATGKAISVVGTGSSTNVTRAVVVLAGNNSFGGGVSVGVSGGNNGILSLDTGTANTNTPLGSGNLTINNGTVNFTTTSAGKAATYANNIVLNGTSLGDNRLTNAGVLTAGASGPAGVTTTLSGVISGGGSAAFYSGPSSFVLSNPANTYTGQTDIDNATVAVTTLANVGSASSLGAPTTAAVGTIHIADDGNGTLQYVGTTNSTTDRSFVANAGNAGNVATLRQSGSGDLTINGNFTSINQAVVLNLAGSGAGKAALNGAISDNTVAKNTIVVKNDSSQWTLGGTNTYTGQTEIIGGVLMAASNAALGAFDVTGATSWTNISGPGGNGTGLDGQLGLTSAGGITTNEVVYISNPYFAGVSKPNIVNSAGLNTMAGNIATNYLDASNTTFTIQSSSGLLTISGDIRQEQPGTAILALRGTSNGVVSGAISQPSGPRPVDPMTTMVGANDVWNLDKEGNGTWTLTNASNAYTGTTNVGNGTLLVNGGHTGGGSYTLNGADGTHIAYLGGTGSINIGLNSVTAGNFSGISPGDSTAVNTIGTLGITASTISFTSLSGLNIEYSGTLSSIDRLNVAGTLDLTNSILNFTSLGGTLTPAVYVFASYTTLTGLPSTINGTPSGFNIDYNYNGLNQIALTPVPEPTTFVLTGLGLCGVCLLRRRRHVSK